jgi:hypothetical protein
VTSAEGMPDEKTRDVLPNDSTVEQVNECETNIETTCRYDAT